MEIGSVKVGEEVRTPYDQEKPKQGTVVRVSECGRFVQVKKKIGTHASATRINEYFVKNLAPMINKSRSI